MGIMRFPSTANVLRPATVSLVLWTFFRFSALVVFTAMLVQQSAFGATDVWSSDFEEHEVDANLEEWLDTAAGSSTGIDDGNFRVYSLEGELVLGTHSQLGNIHSHLQGIEAVVELAEYEFRGRMMTTQANGGLGVTVFSGYQNSDSYYRLRRYGDQPNFQLSQHGSNLSGQLDTGIAPLPNVWYQFAVRAEDLGEETRVYAKVWAEGQAEPSEWQAEGQSTGATRLASGTAGLWSYGEGEKYWDDLRIVSDVDDDSDPDTNPTEVVVPSLLGLGLDEAEATLVELGLVLGSLSFESSSDASDISIVGQSPNSGDTVELGRSVSLQLVRPLVAGAKSMALTWDDNSSNEDGFEVERARMGESFNLLSSVAADSESYVDESVVPGLEYQYRVRAYNAFGYSGYTNVSIGSVPNSAPSLGALEDVSVLKGEDLQDVAFSFSDEESAPGDLILEALSSNLELLPLSGISVVLGDGTGSISLEPVSSKTGTSTVTLLISDGVEVTQQSFELEVLRNLAPTVGSIAAISVYDSQEVGAVAFTISDSETAASQLSVVGTSLDESLIASESISIGGSGANRTVSFVTQSGVAGSTTIRLAVSDGVNTTNAALSVNITKTSPPVISGLEETYTLEGEDGAIELAFTITDADSAVSSLEVSVSSSNALIVSENGLKLTGSGGVRTLDVTPNSNMSGTVAITVSVSDGVHTVEKAFNLRVVAPEEIVNILGFQIEQGLAVVEVENRENATFTLWKIHSVDGAWEKVEDVEVTVGESSTILVDPTPVAAAVCYRVIASE